MAYIDATLRGECAKYPEAKANHAPHRLLKSYWTAVEKFSA